MSSVKNVGERKRDYAGKHAGAHKQSKEETNGYREESSDGKGRRRAGGGGEGGEETPREALSNTLFYGP